ncbi:MAG: hypothetical protein KDI79_00750 [Anaerolineae bacterium]|nr:hypothetical protein [Anaerolineae bacterium]
MEKSKVNLKDGSGNTYELLLVEKPPKPKNPSGCISLMILFVLVLTMCWVYSLLPGTVALAW